MNKIFAVLALVSLVFLMACDELAKDLTSTISGTVYNDGEIVPNALVFLLSPGDTITAGLSLSNATVGKADGTYILVDVITGNHIVCAVKDVNTTSQWTPEWIWSATTARWTQFSESRSLRL